MHNVDVTTIKRLYLVFASKTNLNEYTKKVLDIAYLSSLKTSVHHYKQILNETWSYMT